MRRYVTMCRGRHKGILSTGAGGNNCTKVLVDDECYLVRSDRVTDCVQQLMPAEGFAEKPHGTELFGLRSGVRAIERRDEDDGRTDTFPQKLTAQVQTGPVRKVNVENEASCQRRDFIAQALGGGGK